jgi:hypothetical protein
MGRRVEDQGASECRSVMGRIGVEPVGDITPRESGQTSLWCRRTSTVSQPASGSDAEMSAGLQWSLAGAAATTEIISGAGTVAVTSRLLQDQWSSRALPKGSGVVRCLSRMRRNGARPVLRGRGGSDTSPLPDVRHEVAVAVVLR